MKVYNFILLACEVMFVMKGHGKLMMLTVDNKSFRSLFYFLGKENLITRKPVSFCFAPDHGIAEANKRASSVTVPVGFGYKPSNSFTSLKMIGFR